MGLFSSIKSAIEGVVTNVARVVSDVPAVIEAAAPIALAAFAPQIAPLVGQFFGGATFPSQAPGAVAQASFAQTGGCPISGVLGNPNPFANPLARAAISPGFNIGAFPARPAFGLQQMANAFFPQPQFPQTTSFNQAGFGSSVAPQFRPFAPSFRSGQFGFSGQFQPGISQGLAPQSFQFPGQQQFTQQPTAFTRFGGFPGFGF